MYKTSRILLPLIVVIIGSCSQSNNEKIKDVGIISSNPAIDTLNFKPCYERMSPYYAFTSKTLYVGDKPKIVSHFNDKFNKVSNESGCVTIRFIVNCHGETGRFRVIELDDDYQPKEFSKSLTEQLLKLTMSLDGWRYGEYNENKYDYYNYLTFKLEKGEITKILP